MQEYEQLAETVRLYPCLYDKAKNEYKDKVVTENAWKEVADQLNFIENGKFFTATCLLFYSFIVKNLSVMITI